MALSLAFFSLLVLSLLAIASAGDYSDASSKYGFDGIPADSPQAKPEESEKPQYGTKPGEVKSDYVTNTPKPVEKEKPYVVKPKSEGDGKPYYGANQDKYKSKPEEGAKTSYNRNSYVVKPKSDSYQKAKPVYGTKSDEMKNPLSIAVQGTVLCKTGSKYYPIQGALATITCKAVDEVGVEKTVSICSTPTDAKGYFLVPLSDLGGDKLKLKECKSYLKSSPLEACSIPSNVNKAIEGALLSAFRVLNEKKTKLYSVGPFFYTSQAKPKPASAPQYDY
ncbi:hypothetical protein V6N13_061009 [Hibiscus sabdariffa]|uniref:Uncharacterized protein n=2 Tax=Hibiscus sabdariffa TaxID=183260 RepID=A0ABR2N966_9ROSI